MLFNACCVEHGSQLSCHMIVPLRREGAEAESASRRPSCSPAVPRRTQARQRVEQFRSQEISIAILRLKSPS